MSPRADILAIARLRRSGRGAEAEAQARALVAAAPDDGAAWNELAHVLHARGDFGGAEAAYGRAIAHDATALEPRLNLGVLLARRGAYLEAGRLFERCRELAPNEPRVLSNLGAALRAVGQLERAVAVLQELLAHAPEHAAAHLNLGLALADQGRVAEALPSLERAVALAPRETSYHDALLLQMHYVSLPRARVVAAHRRWAAMVTPSAAPVTPPAATVARDRDPERRLRVGLVSPDLRRHPVAYFLAPLVEHADKARLDFVAYSDALDEDEMSARLSRACAGWRRTAGLDDAALARLVAADGIDALVDLAGHTAGNRLTLFARRHAPLQLSYLGYPDLTGLTTIDARLGDPWSDPPGAEEPDDPLLRLEGGFLVYAPPAESPEVVPPPSLAGAPLTFASFNALNKISEETIASWARILDGAPQSRLWLKQARLDDGGTRQVLLRRLAAQGIAAERVRLEGRSPSLGAHLAAHGAVDVALDTFPYHGTTTTCDALWMGVPVVSLAGATHAARVGVSLLSRAGLADLVAATPDDYVRLALALGSDEERRQRWRAAARDELFRHGLTDGTRLAASFERTLRAAWRRHLEETDDA